MGLWKRRSGKTTPRKADRLALMLPGNVEIELLWCPSGEFTMGASSADFENVDGLDPSEIPYWKDALKQHRVELSAGFWLGKYEVTQLQYEAVTGKNPSEFKGIMNPVDRVDWFDAVEFCRRCHRVAKIPAGFACTLPTEAQWEYACRAGTTTVFHYGNSLDSSSANFDGNKPFGTARRGDNRGHTISVGQFHPNAWGYYDMHGNVAEWCRDWYGEYPNGMVTDPEGGTGSGGVGRISRGGSWSDGAFACRSSNRENLAANTRLATQGFRVALVPVQENQPQ